MVILIGIEGANGNATTPGSYYKGSFIDVLCRTWRDPQVARYIPGPNPAKLSSVNEAAKLAVTHTRYFYGAYNVKGLIIAGYSLGGAAAVVAAHKFNEQGIQVDCLALFDAVDLNFSAVTIPNNVITGIHAVRSGSSGSRPWWPKAGRIGNIQEFPLKVSHWGASGVILTQGLKKVNPNGNPTDIVQEEYPFEKGTFRDTKCTYLDDQLGAGAIRAKMIPRINKVYTDCAIRFRRLPIRSKPRVP